MTPPSKCNTIISMGNAKIVGYVRVSTEEQASSGLSLASQVEKVRAYASLYDLELVEVIQDAGGSARTLHRPGLQHALSLLRKRAVAGVVVVKLDRLTRSVEDLGALIREYFGERARYGVTLHSVSDHIDTRTAAGRLVLHVLAAVAQWEREAIGERTRDALAQKRSRSERISRHVPFGFRLAEDGHHIEPEEGEQKVIAEARALRDSGLSQRAVAQALDDMGCVNRAGHRFALVHVQRLLKRTA